MRRQRILRNPSAQSLCIFCACRLGVDVPSTQLAPFVSSARRTLSTTRIQRQEAGVAPASSNGNGNNASSAPEFAFDPNSSLTRAEQQERARRLALRQEQEIREQQARQEQIWRDQEARLLRDQQRIRNNEPQGFIRKHKTATEGYEPQGPYRKPRVISVPVTESAIGGTTLSQSLFSGQRERKPVNRDTDRNANRQSQQPTRARDGNVRGKENRSRSVLTRSADHEGNVRAASETSQSDDTKAVNPNIRDAEQSGSARIAATGYHKFFRPSANENSSQNSKNQDLAANPNIQNVSSQSTSREFPPPGVSASLRQKEKQDRTNPRTRPADRSQKGGTVRVAPPAFLKSSDAAQDSHSVSGWGMGTTETKPLEYGDPSLVRPQMVASDHQNPAIQDARDGVQPRFGQKFEDRQASSVEDEQSQQAQQLREAHERQIEMARERMEQDRRRSPSQQEARSYPAQEEHFTQPALAERSRREASPPGLGQMRDQHPARIQERQERGPQHDSEPPVIRETQQSVPQSPGRIERPSTQPSLGPQPIELNSSYGQARQPQLHFSMSDAQEYKYDRDYASDPRAIPTPPSGLHQQQPYARPEARVPMSNRYEASAREMPQPYWPRNQPTYAASSERDEYNPEYRISESRSSRPAPAAYDGNWSSFEDEQYGNAGPDPTQHRPPPPPPQAAPWGNQYVPRHYGDEIPHSQYDRSTPQQTQGGPSAWGLEDSYDGIPLDGAQRRPEPHPAEVNRYPQHVPRNARTFGFEEEHRRDPFYAERQQPAPRFQPRNEAPPPSRFSGSFQNYENVQYDAPPDPAADARSQQYQRPFMGSETLGSFESDGYYESQYQYPNSRGSGRGQPSDTQQAPSQYNRSAFAAPQYQQADQRRGGFGYDNPEPQRSSYGQAQQLQDYDRRGVSQSLGDKYGTPTRIDHNDDDDGGQASFYNRQPAPYRPGDSGYRAEPIDLRELGQGEPSPEVDNSANWQHLRRRNPEPVSPPAQYQSHSPPKQALSDQEIDQMFANHVQQRESHYPPPPPPQPRSSDRSGTGPNIHFYTKEYDKDFERSRKCARCGEMGHIARDCSGPLRPRRFNLDSPRRLPNAESQQNSRSSPRQNGSSTPTGESDNVIDYYPPSATQTSAAYGEVAGSQSSDQTTRFTSDLSQPDVEETSKRSARRGRWVEDEDDVQKEESYSSKRKDKRGARRQSHEDDEDDEHQSARDEYRARKAERQSKEDAEREASRRAARKQRAARKAEATTPIVLPEFISVQNLSQVLGVRYEQFVEHLEELGYDDVFPGKTLNSETSGMIAMEYNFEPTFDTGAREEEERDLKPRAEVEDKEFLPVRPPVVTIMGHVDHGKTTILDYLRKSSVAAGEAGGITQHIGAFSVPLASSGKTITFLDTPGHAAFLAMRQRGANVTDIVVLVVAADDSVKPQTLEALKHAKGAGVPIIVAINKVDKPEADIERCKQDLARHGVEIEDFGGDTQVVCVSGKTGAGMDELEETVVTLSEILDHRAETDGPVEGWVLEATTKKAGRVATVLVRRGTLRPGSFIVAGQTWARVRSLRNEAGKTLTEVGPGMPVEVDGWKDQPMAGDEVIQAPSEQKASSVVEYRLELAERERIAQDTEAINEARRIEQQKRDKERAAEQAAKRSTSAVEGDDPVLAPSTERTPETTESGQMIVPFVIKADVSGSAEAVSAYILSVSNPLIAPQILSSSVGAVHESDIELANAAQGHIIAFNLASDPDMKALAESRNVKILENNIIYRVLDDVKAVLEEKLPPIVTQRVLGEAEVSAAFEISAGGRKKIKVAGCKVRNGVVARNARVRITRGGEKVYDGTITSLKNVKKDVTEMRKGSECGMGFEDWEGFEVGDQVQTYVEVEEKRKL